MKSMTYPEKPRKREIEPKLRLRETIALRGHKIFLPDFLNPKEKTPKALWTRSLELQLIFLVK